MERLAPDDGEIDHGLDQARRIPERGTFSLPDAAWTEAQRRAVVNGPLAAQDAVPAAAARDAGRALGLSERTVCAPLRRWRQSGGLAAVLAPRPSPGGRGKGRLPAVAERIVAEAIRDEYLTHQKKRAEAVVRAVRERCRLAAAVFASVLAVCPGTAAEVTPSSPGVAEEPVRLAVTIGGKDYALEALAMRRSGGGKLPVALITHGANVGDPRGATLDEGIASSVLGPVGRRLPVRRRS